MEKGKDGEGGALRDRQRHTVRWGKKETVIPWAQRERVGQREKRERDFFGSGGGGGGSKNEKGGRDEAKKRKERERKKANLGEKQGEGLGGEELLNETN